MKAGRRRGERTLSRQAGLLPGLDGTGEAIWRGKPREAAGVRGKSGAPACGCRRAQRGQAGLLPLPWCGSEGFILRGDLLPPLLFVPSRGLFIALRGLGRCEFVRELLKAAFQKNVRVGKEVAMRYPLSLPALGLSTTRLAKKAVGF